MTKKCKWTVAAAVVLCLTALWFHGTILQWLAAPLIVDEPVVSPDCLAILRRHDVPDGDRCIDEAAEVLRRHPTCNILAVEPASNRLVEIGVLPSLESICRKELELQGVLPPFISSIHSDGYNDWSTSRAIRAWLTDHPHATLSVHCDRFRSAKLRDALDATLDSEQAARVHIHGSPDHRYNESNWWKSRAGIRNFGVAWLYRIHGWFSDPDRISPRPGADAYEHQMVPPSSKADYVMILTGNESTRPFIAAALMKKGFAKRALVSRLSPDSNNTYLPPFEAINREVLIRRGIAPDRIIILPGDAKATFDEARALAAFLKDTHRSHVLIVTDDFHVRRSRWVFSRVLSEQDGHISFVAAPSDKYEQDHWWRDEDGFVFILSEHLKHFFYAVRYGYFIYWLSACCMLIAVAQWIRFVENKRLLSHVHTTV